MIVVIPSNRAIQLSYLTPLIDSGARFIIVDDSEGSISVNHPAFSVYNWGDRRKMLGKLEPGFPKKNGACRDFGFYVAWKQSEPNEIIVALDDDCEVYHPNFAQAVESMLTTAKRPLATCEGTHLNILDLYEDVPANLFPRGFPYSARGHSRTQVKGESSGDVVFSLGLWKNVFDVNAIDKIKGPQYVFPDARLKADSFLLDTGKLVSVCSMNMQFRREVIPAVYQLPMHVPVLPHWVIDRYGDIWGGFVLKALIDRRGQAMAVGEPMIRHLKEGDFQRNIWQEHVCHLVNDEFIDLLLASMEDVSPGEYLAMMGELTEALRKRVGGASALLKTYLEHLCPAMQMWVEALSGS